MIVRQFMLGSLVAAAGLIGGEGVLYFWPPAPPENGRPTVSVADSLLSFTGASHIVVRGLTRGLPGQPAARRPPVRRCGTARLPLEGLVAGTEAGFSANSDRADRTANVADSATTAGS